MVMIAGSNGYQYEVVHYNDSAFKRIPVSFLITMIDSKRKSQFIRELKSFRPTRTTVIVYNQGYKSTNKQNVTNSGQDLWHANTHIFQLTQHMKHPVIVFEDDIEFDLRSRHLCSHIESFVLTQKHNVHAYNLGCVPLISKPTIDRIHMRVYIQLFSQAVIYTRAGRDMLINTKISRLHDLEMSRFANCYASKIPLAYQKIVPTTNSNNTISHAYARLFDAQNFPATFFNFHACMGYIGGVVVGVVVGVFVVIIHAYMFWSKVNRLLFAF